MDSIIVKTRSLKKYYQLGDHTVKALDGVDFIVKEREFTAITGRSGSGKSTLLHLIGGLDDPTEGEIFLEGRNLGTMTKEERTIFRRRRVGFIFQNFNLVPDLTVLENITLPLELDGSPVDQTMIGELLRLLNLKDKKDAFPHMLSGGQQQRAAIARAVAAKPAVILADEPTGSLDTASSHDVLGLLRAAASRYAQTIILITHDHDIAQLADRIVCIEDGKMVKGGGVYDFQQ